MEDDSTHNDHEVLQVSPAARLAQVSAGTIRNLADSGRLPSIKTTDGRRLFLRGDVERVARERREQRKQKAGQK